VPQDEPATGPLPELDGWLGRDGTVVTSPARRCRMPGAAVEPLLRPWDLGCWAGLPLAEVPDLTAWRDDPGYDGHGGESLLALLERAGTLLRCWPGQSGRLAAVTHAGVVRAAVVVVLQAPPAAFWNIDVAPEALTELHRSGSRWRVVRVNAAGYQA
jgi:broad specificity phosphatase PhoE